MKSILLTAVLAAFAGLFPAAPADDGHMLKDLWNQYEDARKADRPQKEAEILAQIKERALKEHLAADFYDAATQYVNTVRRRDWKQGETLLAGLEAEVNRFNQPLVTFLWMREWKRASSDELWVYVKEHLKSFKGNTPALHRGVDGLLNGALKPFIRSDREYVLWALLQNRRFQDAAQDEIYQALKEEVAGSYPGEGALEYYILSRRSFKSEEENAHKQALQALQNKYQGKALALFPEADLLFLQKEELDRSHASGDQYKALDNTCKYFESRRKAFRGEEVILADACGQIAYLLEELESENLDLQVVDKRIRVLFRNLYHANLTLREGKTTVKTWKVVNFDKSFYVQDTVSVDLPELPDGQYTIEARSGKHSTEEVFTHYTLSLALRQDARGRSVYVADYQSGEPLSFVTLRLLKGDREVAVSNLRLNGFTPIPAAFDKAVDERSYYTVEAVSGDRKSPGVNWGRSRSHYSEDSRERARLYLNQGAFRPGETVHFKGIVFKGTSTRGFQAVRGKQVNVVLRDSEGNETGTQTLKTNDWGSVSGSFVIPEGLRGGMFSLSLDQLESTYFRVDEFVLPSFELSFDPAKDLCLVGSEVPVSGTVTSYSGHSLAGARVSLRVENYGNVVLEKEQALGADNRFAFTFPAREAGYYQATVKVTDASGETLEFSSGRYVGNNLSLEIAVPDKADAEARIAQGGRSTFVLEAGTFRLQLKARDASGTIVPLPVTYSLRKADGSQVLEGSMPSGEERRLTLPGSGLYTLKTHISALAPDGEEIVEEREVSILCVLPGEPALTEGVERLFLAGPGSLGASAPIQLRLGSGYGPVWAEVALFGAQQELLSSRQIRLEKGELGTVTVPYLEEYPDAVFLQVFYFQEGEAIRYERVYKREISRQTLPLSFTCFHNKAYPGTQYTFTLKTAPGTEVLAAAWDKSLDAVRENTWPGISFRDALPEPVSLSTACGRVGSSGRFFGERYNTRMLTKASAGAVLEDSMVNLSVQEAAVGAEEEAEEVRVRTNFASALTFQPHLYPQADGSLAFSFRTSDKLSTYYIRVYAHDKKLNNAVCQQEMVVSLPVKVSLLEPRFLYEGDVCEVAVTLSSVADEPVSGKLVLQAGDSVQELPVTLAPGASQTQHFPVSAGESTQLVLTASFVAPEYSDAVQVSVPVFPAAQELTEAHSAVLLSGMSREALLADLRSRFVNVPGSEAALEEISVLEMVKEAIPSHIEPKGNDVLSLSEAWYIRQMASSLGVPAPEDDLLERILACRNADGGFAWFEGMGSNAIITAVVLERMALLRDRGFQVPDLSAAVRFLDKMQFEATFPLWCGGLSDAQYMRVRALYAQIPFEYKPVSAAQKERLAQFKKSAKAYLVPGGKNGRGLQGQILAKARRLLTLRSLQASDAGRALAKAWGVRTGSKLEKSIRADVTSLLEYAVEHRDGGWYYPNAVLPYRSLLESEAYAHALLCQLLQQDSPVVADGIRLWLMVQKETQQWEAEPAFIDALTVILDGSQELLDTRVMALSARYEAPFRQIQASGNGFTLERQFFREVVLPRLYDDQSGPDREEVRWEPLQVGESVKVGDKIRVEYKIWNAENRSFVKLTAGREASLRPVQQLSGYVGGGLLRPLRQGYTWNFTPQGYRQVKERVTEFYFDSYPEEETSLTEEFFVTQAGHFEAPVTIIESVYAPHYRANSIFRPALVSRQ